MYDPAANKDQIINGYPKTMVYELRSLLSCWAAYIEKSIIPGRSRMDKTNIRNAIIILIILMKAPFNKAFGLNLYFIINNSPSNR